MNRPVYADFQKRTLLLDGATIALLATDGVEIDELARAKRELGLAGARVVVVGPKPGRIAGFRQLTPVGEPRVDVPLDATTVTEFDGLFIPGGVLQADALRCMPRVVAFVREFVTRGLPVSVLGHAASLLIEAGVVRGHRLSSWPSLKTDLTNAGARWVDRDVVRDGRLLSGRAVPAFYDALPRHFAHEAEPQSATLPRFLTRILSTVRVSQTPG